MTLLSPSRVLPVLAGLALLAAPAPAEDLQPQWIDKDARWLAHVDLEKAWSSPLFGQVQKLREFGEVQEQLAEVKAELGFDPLHDVFGVTVYSAGDDPEDAVAFVEMRNAGDALAKLAEHLDVDEVELEGYSVRRIGKGGEGAFVKVVPIEGEERSLVVMAEEAGLLVQALDVLAGERGNMGDQGAALKARPSRGAIFFAAAVGLQALMDEVGDFEPASRLAKGAKSVVIEAGEGDGKAFFSLDAHVENEKVAGQLRSLIQGVQAFAQLAPLEGEEMEQVQMLTRGLKVKAEGDHVALHFEFPTEELLKLLADHIP